MLNSYYIENLIGFQGVQAKNIEEKEEKLIFSIELERKEVKCQIRYNIFRKLKKEQKKVDMLKKLW